MDLRAVISAIFYILYAGCEWRMLPYRLPQMANGVLFRKRRMDGRWEPINHKLQQ
ncbi:hypothetical protein [uncultured Nostoc sp.]|uniref:hypothetical protein n=1 Tax=uncultured Nostoc sp. TaxID=340711 RepID=UPI003459EC2F